LWAMFDSETNFVSLKLATQTGSIALDSFYSVAFENTGENSKWTITGEKILR